MSEVNGPIDVTRRTQGRMLEALKMLCGVLEGFPTMLAEPSVNACHQTASALIDQVIAEETHNFKPEPLSDFPQRKAGHSEAMEQCYRRGYFQGYWSAMDDCETHSTRQMEEHLNTTLYKWRYETPLDVIEFPKDIDAKKKS